MITPSKKIATNLTQHFTGESAGFSLVETIVAIAILLVVVSGIMNLIYQGATASQGQQDRITATYLAADAMEYIRSLRDTYWLEDLAAHTFVDWASTDPVNRCTGSSDPCRVDTRFGLASTTAIQSCSGTCPPLEYNTSTNLYGYGNGSATRFTRSISYATTNGGDEADFTVTVTWEGSGGDTSGITIEESIFGWWR
jgi:prepilin-type N-terminal cleavage/methylation domain-containing protein